jgi:hypothetical protein
VDNVVAQAGAIERHALATCSEREGIEPDDAFGTLITGLASRYHRAVSG